MGAAYRGRKEVCEMLLKKGANRDLTDIKGKGDSYSLILPVNKKQNFKFNHQILYLHQNTLIILLFQL